MGEQDSQIILDKNGYDAVIFDLDGVITKTAKLHSRSWKKLFDEFREKSEGTWREFDQKKDYPEYVDGKPRYEGVKSFLESRGIDLEYGSPDDSPKSDTLCGLGNRKNEIFREILDEEGVEPYEPAVGLVKELREKGIKTAVVSSSKNCEPILKKAGLEDLFDTLVDGILAEKLKLTGKPDPDIFIEAANRLDVVPERCAVIEDAEAGVAAGSSGNFGCVIGVDRTGHGEELKKHGADRVLKDLSFVKVVNDEDSSLPWALEGFGRMKKNIVDKQVALFLDYDGTLTPIVDSPEKALLSDSTREAVEGVSNLCPVAVISGRDLKDVRNIVGIDGIYYAGSHGFDISGPEIDRIGYQEGTEYLPLLDDVEEILRKKLEDMDGVVVERKRFSIAVHYRMAREEYESRVNEEIDSLLSQRKRLKKSSGKKIYEVQPDIDWNKGKALFWLLDALDMKISRTFPIYIGDDTTDEDAFKAIKNTGLGIVVMEQNRESEADEMLNNTEEVETWLRRLAQVLKGE